MATTSTLVATFRPLNEMEFQARMGIILTASANHPLLPVIESGFNPMAESPAQAAGLWQFIPGTGTRYKLHPSIAWNHPPHVALRRIMDRESLRAADVLRLRVWNVASGVEPSLLGRRRRPMTRWTPTVALSNTVSWQRTVGERGARG